MSSEHSTIVSMSACSLKHCRFVFLNHHCIKCIGYRVKTCASLCFSRFTQAVCSPRELSCWPVSRDGRISRRRVWPAHPKALMFHPRHYCCQFPNCSRAATKVSLYHVKTLCQRGQIPPTLCLVMLPSYFLINHVHLDLST